MLTNQSSRYQASLISLRHHFFMVTGQLFLLRQTQLRANSSSTNSFDLKHQLQLRKGATQVLSQIKENDNPTMLRMLRDHAHFDDYRSWENPYCVTDIGGSNGRWILQSLLSTGMKLLMSVCEPEEESLRAYHSRVQRYQREGKPITLRDKLPTLFSLQDPSYQLPPSDLVLCSHSLYYTARQWEHPSMPLDKHIFTKLLFGLKRKGVLCVILQSADPRLSTTKTALHADLEDFTYPLMKSKKESLHAHTDVYTTAELFELALRQYASLLKSSTSLELDITSMPSITQVSLGDINFDKIDPNTGRYKQLPSVTELLNFYTNMEFDPSPESVSSKSKEQAFTPEKQELFLNFIKKYCHMGDSQYCVTHVNKVFMITLSELLDTKHIETLCQTNNLSLAPKP